MSGEVLGDDKGAPGLRLHAVGCAQAAGALRELLGVRRAGDPLAPATVVAPTGGGGVALRRSLAGAPGGLVGVRVLVWAELAELLGARPLARSGRTPLTAALHREHVRLALAAAPGALGRVATHPATAQLVDHAAAELRRATAAGGEHDVLTALDAGSALPRTLAGLHRTLRRATAATCYDTADLTLAAAQAARSDARALADTGAVLLFLPRTLDPAEVELVRVLAQRVPVDVVLGLTGDTAADTPARRLAALLTSAPTRAHPSDARRPAPGGEPAAAVPAVVPAVVRSAPDADEEVRVVVRSIAGLLRDGEATEGIAVLFCDREPYASLAAEHLAAAGIPANGPVSRTLGQSLPGRVLLELLALPDVDFARQSVADWLALAPLHPAEGPVPVERWTAVADAAGVARGREQWDRRLRALLCGGDGDLLAARDLLAFVQRVFGALDGPQDRTWRGFAAWAEELLDACLGPPSARADWPADDRGAEVALRERLTALATLDTAAGATRPAERRQGSARDTALTPEPGQRMAADAGRLSGPSQRAGVDSGQRAPDGELDVATFRRALGVELDAPAGRLGTDGVGVFLGPVTAAAGRELVRVFVVGMAEGAFPSRPAGQPLLPDALRRTLVARHPELSGVLATREEHVAAERAALFGVVASAAHTTLSYPRADRRQQRERMPSAWFLELAGARAGASRPLLADELAADRSIDGYEPIASAAAGIEGAGEPATPAEWIARELLAGSARGEDVLATPVLTAQPGLGRAVAAARARAAAAFSPWDGHVGPVPALAAHLTAALSPTRLARYATCPRQYFLSSLLGVRERESRDDPFALEGARRGLLLHQILQRVLTALIAQPPTDADEARDVLRRVAGHALGPAEAEAGASLPARLSAEAVRAWLQRWLVEHAALAADLGVVPVGAELAFGGDADPLGAVRVALPGGRELAFRGRVDRLDAALSGDAVLVIDYKTSADDGYKGIEADPVLGGRELQLAVYGLAAAGAHPQAEVSARYWFLGPRTSKAAHRGFVLDERRRNRAVAVLDVLADGIANGVFPGRPGAWNDFRGAYEHCRSCAFDRICPAPGDRERTWERDARDPVLHRYAALAGGGA